MNLACCLNPVVERQREELTKSARQPKSEESFFLFLAAKFPVLAEIGIDVLLDDFPSQWM